MTFVHSPTRRELLKVAGAAVAVAATADSVAEAQMAGGKIKAIGFDAFTIFDVRSIDAAFEENFPGRAKEIAATWRTRLFQYTSYAQPDLRRPGASLGRRPDICL